jgi:hypothetical protein
MHWKQMHAQESPTSSCQFLFAIARALRADVLGTKPRAMMSKTKFLLFCLLARALIINTTAIKPRAMHWCNALTAQESWTIGAQELPCT